MRRRAKRIRGCQARERKKEGKPAYFGACVKTRFRKTGLVKSKGNGPRARSVASVHSNCFLSLWRACMY